MTVITVAVISFTPVTLWYKKKSKFQTDRGSNCLITFSTSINGIGFIFLSLDNLTTKFIKTITNVFCVFLVLWECQFYFRLRIVANKIQIKDISKKLLFFFFLAIYVNKVCLCFWVIYLYLMTVYWDQYIHVWIYHNFYNDRRRRCNEV